jgi:hypothetical protein
MKPFFALMKKWARVFVAGENIHPCLIFVSKAGAYPRKQLLTFYEYWQLALLTIISKRQTH